MSHPQSNRSQRVAHQMQREIAVLIQNEVNDPHLGMVTVSGAEVSRDLAVAKVYVTTMNATYDRQQVLDVLNKAAGFLRRMVGQRLRLRSVPQIRFFYDESIEHGALMSALIDRAVAEDSHDASRRDEQDKDENGEETSTR
jgi:ribosome-binding factor A